MFFESYLGKLLGTFLISMVPVIELRGAIPIGLGMGLPLWEVVIISVIGNLVPIPFIILFIRKIFEWMRSKSEKLNTLVCKLEDRAMSKADTVKKYTFWGLFIFVAIPLPGTGAWTGALIAALLEVRLKIAIPAIFLGVICAAIIMTTLSLFGLHIFGF